ncbi:N-acetyltransferase [Persicobacter sp. CCB-QB2]|uniref:GNAT family N-acetyltransferase n=1 Tax=Persicobacter sp. CCB-QB2 TaxID=1561025 RepID=UPI0006A97563|nr:GNAT family N-acetyltransferase [Persicobacter sp. CCB-QB2]
MKIKKAEAKDKNTVVNILTTSFARDAHIQWLLEKSDYEQKVPLLMAYLFEEAIRSGVVYLTEDETAAAIWKGGKKMPFSWKWLGVNLEMLLKLGLPTIIRNLQTVKFTSKHLAEAEQYYNLYSLGVLPESRGKGYASLLMDAVLEKKQKEGVPVYLETASLRNVSIYEKKGFVTYSEYKKGNHILYHMKKSAD